MSSILQRLNEARAANSATAGPNNGAPTPSNAFFAAGPKSPTNAGLGSFRSSGLSRAGAFSLGDSSSSLSSAPSPSQAAVVAAAVAAAKAAFNNPTAAKQTVPGTGSFKSTQSNSINSLLAADLQSLSRPPAQPLPLHQPSPSPRPAAAFTPSVARPPMALQRSVATGHPATGIHPVNPFSTSHPPTLGPHFTSIAQSLSTASATSGPSSAANASATAQSSAPAAAAVDHTEVLGPFDRDRFMGCVSQCSNCDSHDEKLSVFCHECQAAHLGGRAHSAGSSSGASGPILELFVLCENCNQGLHKPAKMQAHKRIPFRYFATTLRTAAECAIREKQFPAALVPLAPHGVHLCVCTNCHENAVNSFCQECQLLLCRSCVRELHAPKNKKSHLRYHVPWKFVTPAANTGTIVHLAAAPSPSPSPPPAAAAATAAAPAAAPSSSTSLPSRFTVPPVVVPATSSSPAASARAKPTPPSNTAGTRFVSEFEAAEAKYNAGSSSKAVTWAANTTVAGDVLHVHEIALEGDLQAEMLQCRNTFNAFDFIGNVQIVQICAGQSHCGAVTAGGSLFMWGSNNDWQLGFDCGDAKECMQPTVLQIPGNRNVRMIACGYEHSICCTTDNSVFTWGSGLMGMLGHNSDANCETPTQINWKLHTKASAGPLDPKEEIIAVSAGQHNSGCIVRGRKDKKQLYMWGGNNSGLLGTGDRTPRLVPTIVKLDTGRGAENSSERLPEVTSLAFGGLHSVLVTSAGEVYTCGGNSFGQLGYHLTPETPSAGAAPSFSQAMAPPLGRSPSVARYQQAASTSQSIDSLSDPTEYQLTFRLVFRLKQAGVRAVHACTGELMTSILTSQGEIYSWGSGETHQLGIMDNVDQFLPVKAAVLGGENSELRAVSLAVGTSACAAVTETGDVYAWGYSVESPVPALVNNLRSNCIQRVALGALNNLLCLTGVANEVFEWRFTEEGDEAATSEPQLNRQLRGKRVQSMAVGRSHYAITTQAGKLIVWGMNVDNQLGLEVESSVEGEEILRPIEVSVPWTIKEVRCAAEHSVALTDDGKVLCWGIGGMGRLGHGNDADQKTPRLVSGLEKTPCIAIAIGPHNTGAVTADHKAYIWGSGHAGQLGNNSNLPVLSPIPLALKDERVSALDFGNRHTALITVDGKLFTFGENAFGQLGLSMKAGKGGESAKYATPQRVETMAKHRVVGVSCGDNITFCLSDAGEVHAFGQGETHQLCTADGEDTNIPVLISFPFSSEVNRSDDTRSTKITHLSVSAINCSAVTDNGSVYVWGFQLGTKPTRIESLYKAKKKILKSSMGPSSLMLAT